MSEWLCVKCLWKYCTRNVKPAEWLPFSVRYPNSDYELRCGLCDSCMELVERDRRRVMKSPKKPRRGP